MRTRTGNGHRASAPAAPESNSRRFSVAEARSNHHYYMYYIGASLGAWAASGSAMPVPLCSVGVDRSIRDVMSAFRLWIAAVAAVWALKARHLPLFFLLYLGSY